MAASLLKVFPQLKSDNFDNWLFRLNCLLEEKQLKDVINVESQHLKEEELKNFIIKDAQAKSILVQCLEDKHLNLVKNCRTANEMISALKTAFQRKSIVSKLNLRRKLLSIKCKDEKLEDYFNSFDTIVRELESIGNKLEEEDKICYLFTGLPIEYNTVITAIETINPENIKYDFVKARLLDEEMKIKSKIENNENDSAFAIQCYKCGKNGHKSFQCHSNNKGNRGRGRINIRYRTSQTPPVRRWNQRNEQLNLTNEQDRESNNSDMFVACLLNDEETFDSIRFIIDSGASYNFIKSNHENKMKEVKILQKPVKIKIANGEILTAYKSGLLNVYYKNKPLTIEGLIVSGLQHNLLSVNRLMERGYEIIFKNGHVIINGKRNKYYGEKLGNIYIIKVSLNAEEHQCYYMEKDIWHKRMGHLNRKCLKIMNLPSSDEMCDICMKNKSTRLPFKKITGPQSHYIGELIHTDIAGPTRTPTKEGHRYIQTILDDYTHFTQTYLLKNKNEASDNLINYIKQINTEKGVKVKRIRCDNGGEFTSNYFKNYCKNKGISLEYTAPYSPQMNGKAERLNRTIYDKARTMLDESNLPRHLWGQAILTATFLINRSPTAALRFKIPAIEFGTEFDLNKIKVFGCKAWATIIPRGDKFDNRAITVRMVGYAKNGYKVWNPETDEVFITRDVKFQESNIKYNKVNDNIEKYINKIEKESIEKDDLRHRIIIEENSGQNAEKYMDKIQEKEIERDIEQKENDKFTTSRGRVINKPDYLKYYDYEAFCLLNLMEDPVTYKEAVKNEEWKVAIEKELNALEKTNTWTPVILPHNKKPIDSKWVFRTKDNGIKKARLVARGFQVKDEEFTNHYAPVARISSVRMLLAYAVQKSYSIFQMDMPSAFLNGILEEEVYLLPPEGVKTKEKYVLKLNRGLYGLKQSPKCWNERFNNFILEKGFQRSKNDFCLYIKQTVLIIIYVDDILLTGQQEGVSQIMKDLKEEFCAKDMGQVEKFLGMEITREENSLKITQTGMIEKMLEKFNMKDANPSKTPILKGFQVEDKEIEDVPYRQLIGCLMFIATVSRPDISYVTSFLSQYLDKPTKSVWIQAKRTLRYLKGTKEYGLIYEKTQKNEDVIETFSDADWGGNSDRKSISGSVTLYNGNIISWLSRKQNCIALSTTEAEYVAAAVSACDLIYTKRLYFDLNFNVSNLNCILYVDNRGALQLTKSFENSKRAKHIDIKTHFIKDLVKKGEFSIQYIQSKSNLADIFTKSLSYERFIELRLLLKIN